MNDPQSLFIVVFSLVVIAAVLLIYGFSNKDSGGFIGKLQAWSTRQQAGSRQASNESLKAKLDGETLEAEHDNATRLRAQQTEAGVAQAQASVAEAELSQKTAWLGVDLLARAKERGVDVPTYLSMAQKEEFNRLDLAQEIELMKAELKYAFISKNLGQQQFIDLLTTKLDDLYFQIDDIEKSNASEKVKKRQIEMREEYAKTLLEQKRAREKKLLEGDNGGGLSGDDQEGEL